MIAKVLSRIGIEIWKDLPEYEGLYQVSNLGNVRSLKFNKIRYIKSLNDKERYAVTLYKNKIRTTNNRVSVLVAEAFLNHNRCGNKIVVDHIDNNKINDRLYNLQLISTRKNSSKDKKGTSKYTGVYKPTREKKWKAQIRINGKVKHLGTFKDEKKAAKAYKNELKKINESNTNTL
tara:strand:+ start:3100 stop:3627 length:528 start_codon:yes stop_codon:yes gene_type:complete